MNDLNELIGVLLMESTLMIPSVVTMPTSLIGFNSPSYPMYAYFEYNKPNVGGASVYELLAQPLRRRETNKARDTVFIFKIYIAFLIKKRLIYCNLRLASLRKLLSLHLVLGAVFRRRFFIWRLFWLCTFCWSRVV